MLYRINIIMRHACLHMYIDVNGRFAVQILLILYRFSINATVQLSNLTRWTLSMSTGSLLIQDVIMDQIASSPPQGCVHTCEATVSPSSYSNHIPAVAPQTFPTYLQMNVHLKKCVCQSCSDLFNRYQDGQVRGSNSTFKSSSIRMGK